VSEVLFTKGVVVPGSASRPARVIPREGYVLTDHRALCRRGVLWIGQTCNLRCHFCYFLDKIADAHHPEHAFMSLDKIKQMCRTLVDVYGNNSVDIQGGEPTIYRDIVPLIQYCNEIGLKPTLITNGFSLANMDKCRQLKDAGVYDFLISVHGLADHYDRIVRVPGAASRLQRAIANLSELGVPFRFNTVLCQEALPDLMDIARLAVGRGARAVNFIAFNPFIDQSGSKRSIENVPRYADVVEHLLPALDHLDANHVEVNVRYLPFCLFPERYRKFVQNFQQIVYDLHEWESAGEAWTGAAPQRQTTAPLSEPVNFFSHVEALRVGAFGCELDHLSSDQRWSPSVRFALNRLEARPGDTPHPLRASRYSSAPVGDALVRAAAARPALRDRVTFVAYVSSPEFRTSETLNGLPWETTDWLAATPTDVVFNTSQSSRGAIARTLERLGLADRAIEVFESAATTGVEASLAGFSGQDRYEYLPYLPELGSWPGAGTLDKAYKEYRVLMPKVLHPYAKEGACRSCSLVGICDGFHRDYAEFFGFDEARSQRLPAAVFDPCHYSCEQLKVVEAQEYDWALPGGVIVTGTQEEAVA